jgi:hypothetical protein
MTALRAVNRHSNVHGFILPILFILSKSSCGCPPNRAEGPRVRGSPGTTSRPTFGDA